MSVTVLVDLSRNDDTDEPETREKKGGKNALVNWAKRAESFVVLVRKHAILLHILLVNHKYFVGTIIVLCWRTDEIPM